jgi:hypothetical protein
MIMHSTSFSRAAWAALVLVTSGAGSAAAKPRPGRPAAFNLFALPVHVMNVNRAVCPITDIGFVCVDSTLSPVLEGAFWPKGTPDNYVFNSGLQIGGFVDSTAGGGKASFPWAGDLVGSFFMDPRGDQYEGDAVTTIYSSLDPVDIANWPAGAVIRDTAIYHPSLIGRNSISQEDLWVRVWDGNPTRLAGRTHPMGIMVEERGLAWNFPSGNEDIVYFTYTFYNVTASDCTVYQNLDPAIQQDVCNVGKNFQALNAQRFGITFPAQGWTFNKVFATFFEDCDVGNASINYSTANLIFDMGFCWKSDFNEPAPWVSSGPAFAPPQVGAPGFTGTKYLSSPKDSTGKKFGLTLFSNEINGATGYPDAVGVNQMYRYISGTSSPAAGDQPCTFQGQQLQRHYCFLAQFVADTRFFISSGPFTLKPGQVQSMTVAYMFAAPDSQVIPWIGLDLKPGIPPSPRGLVTGADTLRVIDRATGWVSHQVLGTDTVIKQAGVTTVPRSLLNKALVAQAVFDKKFLLPSAPQQPNFFLVPGDNQVTISWEPTASEQTGDPYYVVASQPKNPDGTKNALYDPNFRHFDVEGYRIYRGRTSGDLKLVVQFDYAGTTITDYTGNFLYPGNCAPELVVQTDCPVTFDTGSARVVPASPHVDIPLIGAVVQVPIGGRVKLADGSILLLKSDTAVTGAGFPGLQDTGVPFVYVDKGVRNSFTYFYAVTAFNVNSLFSGPSSLESSVIGKQVTPRKVSGQETAGSITTPVLLSSRGDTLNANATPPTIDAVTGEFSGPQPPTNGFQTSLAVFVPQLLASGSVSVTIDSVSPGQAPTFALPLVPTLYYLTSQGPTGSSHAVIPLNVDGTNSDSTTTRYVPVTGVDKTKVGRYGGDSSFAVYASLTVSAPGTWRTESYGRGAANSSPANSPQNGPRWWAGAANENTPSPNSGVCAPGSGCIDALFNSRANVKTAGSLPGVQYLLNITSYLTVPNPMRTIEPILASVTRAADFKVYWKAGGGLDSVVDVTHKIPVPFSKRVGTGWGFLNDSSFVNVPAASTPDKNNAVLSWTDVFCVAPIPTLGLQCGSGATASAVLMDHARLSPVADTSVAFAASPPATGSGFIFYIGGHFFMMQMSPAALPAAGTVWNLRTYAGNVTGTAGTYGFVPANFSNPAVPGLKAQFSFTGSTYDPTKTNDTVFAKIHTVPDPYYVTNALEFTANNKVLKFVNLPAQCIIRIYSTSGILVQVLTHNDATGGSETTWNLRNRNSQFVASGVYFYHVEAPDGKTKIGRFTVINFAP